eukprot:symbB.v1.2.018982.t1/scaffold1531.1/size113404/1
MNSTMRAGLQHGLHRSVRVCVTEVTLPCRRFSALQHINDEKFKALCDSQLTPSNATPFLVHCGASWSQRSQRVADALAEWDSGDLPIYSLDVSRSPKAISQRHIKGIPTLLLMRENRIEARADGADLKDLERLKSAAKPYVKLSNVDSDAASILKSAEVMLNSGGVIKARELFQQALKGPIHDGAYRARLGLVKCAKQVLEEACATDKPEPSLVKALFSQLPAHLQTLLVMQQDLATALAELKEHHEEELLGSGEEVRVDAQQQTIMLADAELLVDAWSLDESRCEEETKILQLWARGERESAFQQALKWYQSTAGNDIPGLIASYLLPERRMLDRPGAIPRRSIYAQRPELAADSESPGPTVPRALLRRMSLAAMDRNFLEGKPSLLAKSLAELAFLLDRKEFIPFHTRKIRIRRGGPPTTGRGTGKRSGFSKRYWICWPDTVYPNSRKMATTIATDARLERLLRARSLVALQLLRQDPRGRKVARSAAEKIQVERFWQAEIWYRPRWTWALELLRDDVRILNQVLSVLARAAQWEVALKTLGEKQKRQVNIVSLNSVALALANEAQWQRAMTLLQPWWPFATAITFNTLALACKDASQWQQTLAVLDFAQRRHCTDGRSKSTLLSALAKVARWEEAFCFALSNTMDDVALSAAINACEKGWQWRPALHLLHSLEHDH